MTNEDAIKMLKSKMDGSVDTSYEWVETVRLAIKALEQQPCEDCISRDAVDEYITNLLSGYLYDEERTRLEDLTAFVWELPSVTPKPCVDAISRAGALRHRHLIYDDDGIGYSVVRVDEIMAMPSVTPKAKTGHWIEKEDYNLDIYYECSECGADYCIEGDILIHKYCPNCGARMTEVESEEEDD